MDAGPVGRWRRDADVERRRAQVPSPVAVWQSAVHELLAGRLGHPRYRRYVEAEVRVRYGLEPAVSMASHTCLRIPFKIRNRDFMVVTDEDVFRQEDYTGTAHSGANGLAHRSKKFSTFIRNRRAKYAEVIKDTNHQVRMNEIVMAPLAAGRPPPCYGIGAPGADAPYDHTEVSIWTATRLDARNPR